VRRLDIQDRWNDAWELEIVKQRYRNDFDKFKETWDNNVHWIPNWKCPDQFFFWPEVAVNLDPRRITGKQRLLNMFGRYTEIGPDNACRIMTSVPIELRTSNWSRIYQEIDGLFENTDDDLVDIRSRKRISETTKQALIDARLGQGDYRASVMKTWHSRCAVTSCSQQQVLIASHIKPWKYSSDVERLNPRNGLLLSENLDALFDRGLISFMTSGEMLISSEVLLPSRELLGIPASLSRRPNVEEIAFLEYHRDMRLRP
jgi:hypothetical protein